MVYAQTTWYSSRDGCHEQVSLCPLLHLPSILPPITPCRPDEMSRLCYIGRTVEDIAADALVSSDHANLGFALIQQAHHGNRPNRVRVGQPKSSFPADWMFASGCSPPRLAATQLPPATRDQTSLDEDFHLANATTVQAHWIVLRTQPAQPDLPLESQPPRRG